MTKPFFCICEKTKAQISCMVTVQLIMPPTLKKLMGHIAFGACVSGWVTLFVPTVTFKPLSLES